MSQPFCLIIHHADGHLQRVELPSGRHVLGRDPECGVVIASQEVSRRHARLELTEKDFTIEDLGSTSGTYVLGRLLTGAQRLPLGHSFQLGTVSIEVQSASSATAKGADRPSASPANTDSAAERYAPGAELGRGGMGVVRQSEDLKLGRQVAMKVMLEGNKKSFDARLRFYQEAEILARLEHPNIVPMHDLGQDAQGRPYYTMKEVKGFTLQKVLNDLRDGNAETVKKFPLVQLLGIFLKICDGVGFAHDKGIVHRDLKPENVMLGEFGEVLVMDWGLAKDLSAALPGSVEPAGEGNPSQSPNESGSGLTMDGAVMGTPHYMPPEQAEGRQGDIDERSDVFSLGAVLYAILTLHPPVKGKTLAEVLANVKSGNIHPPTSYNPGGASRGPRKAAGEGDVASPAMSKALPHCPNGRVPGPLSAVAMRALAFERDDRYPSVAMLAADIESYLSGRATSAEQAGLLTVLWLLIQRNKAVVYPAIAAIGLVVLVTLGFMGKVVLSERKATMEAAKAREAESVARVSLGKAHIALAEAAFRNVDVTAMAQALDACPEELREGNWNYFSAKRNSAISTLNVAGLSDVDMLAAVPGRPGQFALASSKGDKVVFADALNNRVMSVINVNFNGRPKLAFSGDGKRLAAWGGRDGPGSHQILLLEVITGKTLKAINVEKVKGGKIGKYLQACALNQDGTLMACTVGADRDHELQLIETDTGTVRWSKEPTGICNLRFHPDGGVLVEAVENNRTLFLRSVTDGRIILNQRMHLRCAEISPSGRYLAVGTHEGLVHILNATNGTQISSGRLHTTDVYDLEWTADERLITVGSQGKLAEHKPVLRVWDTDGFVPLATMFGFNHGNTVEFSFDRASGLLVTLENPPRVWRIPVGIEQKVIPHVAEQGWSVSFVSDRAMLARSSYDLGLYDPHSADFAEANRLTTAGDHRIGASHRGKQWFAVAYSTANRPPFDIRVFELKDNAPVPKISITVRHATDDLRFDERGEKLLSVYKNGTAEVWSSVTGKSLLYLPKPDKNEFKQAAFVSGGRIAAFASVTRTATAVEDQLLLYSESGKLLQTVTSRSQIYSLAVSPDGSLIGIAGADQSISIYQSADLKHVRTFRAHDDPVTVVVFHPTKPIVASASMDHSVKLWDYQSGKMLDYFLGPIGTPVSLAFSPSGKYLGFEGQDRFTRVWQLEGKPTNAPRPISAPPTSAPSKKKRNKQ